jgi:hypothetical protein
LWFAVTAILYASLTTHYVGVLESNRAHAISRAANGLTALSDYGLLLDSAAWTLDAPRLTSSDGPHIQINYTANQSMLSLQLPGNHTASKAFVCRPDFFEFMPANSRAVWRTANASCVVGTTS